MIWSRLIGPGLSNVVDSLRQCTGVPVIGQCTLTNINDSDTNLDGEISKAEWVATYGSDKGLADYDLNGDGIVDADEWKKMNAAKAEEGATEAMVAKKELKVGGRVRVKMRLRVRVGSRSL